MINTQAVSIVDPVVAVLERVRLEQPRAIPERGLTRADFDAQQRPPDDYAIDPGWPPAASEQGFDALLELGKSLGGELSNAIVYPEGSVMAWHTNSNAPGRRRYYTWSKQGGGVFRYLDPVTGEVIDDEEPAGWLIREFTIPREGLLWHTIFAPDERWTFGFLLPEGNGTLFELGAVHERIE